MAKKKWFFQFAINYAWSPSLFETDYYGEKRGYETKEEARSEGIKHITSRIDDENKEINELMDRLSYRWKNLQELQDSKKKLEEL